MLCTPQSSVLGRLTLLATNLRSRVWAPWVFSPTYSWCQLQTETLVSVGAFLDQHGGTLQFTGKHVLYHASKASKRQLVGRRREDGLYLACNLPAAPPKAFLGKKQIQFQLLRERIHALHRCFGHATRERMRTILTNNSIAGISPHHVSLLTSCVLQRWQGEESFCS